MSMRKAGFPKNLEQERGIEAALLRISIALRLRTSPMR